MTSNIAKLRGDFPIFHTKPDWAYLDAAATSQVPQVVLDAVSEYHCAYRASVHRGLYKEALRVTEVYEEARATMARFIHADASEEVVFTSGATGSSNMLALMLERTLDWKRGDRLLTTRMEHHASLLPLQQLAARNNLELEYIPLTKRNTLALSKLEGLLEEPPRIVSVMLASNVSGAINDVRRVARLAYKAGALVVCDATAAVGHMPIDVQSLGVDFLYFSGHKMCGPTGIGVLYGKRELLQDMEPAFVGGGMVEDVEDTYAQWRESPTRFEAGTPNIAGVIGMAAAATYLERHGLQHIRTYVEALTTYARERIGGIDGVHCVAVPAEKNVGIVSFTVEGIHPHDVVEIAARNGVALRAGHHCALPFHKVLGLNATIRASIYLYNTKRDIDLLAESVEEARKVFGVQ